MKFLIYSFLPFGLVIKSRPQDPNTMCSGPIPLKIHPVCGLVKAKSAVVLTLAYCEIYRAGTGSGVALNIRPWFSITRSVSKYCLVLL
ncbi:hypothetical protein AVEN_14275-1 [Araneus ventricosus]|uniref:Uncharacterized protein n=1 Tax=Araneus ventricosus TaxID=182803 RepID=A0A4Y2MC90_ARAVE|nr:hypothetical protein AVEN_14275-1 [Araneus ventricosus]